MGTHIGIANRLQWMCDTFPFSDDDVCCAKTAITFVDSVWEVFGPLLAGVPLAMLTDDASKDIGAMVHELEQLRVTRLVLVPVLLSVLLDTIVHTQAKLALNLVIVSGDVLEVSLLRRFCEVLPTCRLLNLYGSTEVAGDATFYECDIFTSRSVARVPIGKPISNTTVHILDEHLAAVPVGCVGEICITGLPVAMGYWQNT